MIEKTFITKEDIQKEGWTLSAPPHGNPTTLTKDKYILKLFTKGDRFPVTEKICDDYYLIVAIGEEYKDPERILYCGQCESIGQFRTIIGWLKIKTHD